MMIQRMCLGLVVAAAAVCSDWTMSQAQASVENRAYLVSLQGVCIFGDDILCEKEVFFFQRIGLTRNFYSYCESICEPAGREGKWSESNILYQGKRVSTFVAVVKSGSRIITFTGVQPGDDGTIEGTWADNRGCFGRFEGYEVT